MYNLGMKLNEYIKQKQIESGLNSKAFAESHDISQAQYYRYINEEYMKNITPLIASKICKAFELSATDLNDFDDSFALSFISRVEDYLFGDDLYVYLNDHIHRFYNYFLVDHGFNYINFEPKSVIRNGSCYVFEEKYRTRMPYLRSQELDISNAAIAKHENGNEYVILFFEPKHIAPNTTIYDSKFHAVHLFLVWAVSQMSREDHKYDNNFIFLTTSDFIYDNIIKKDSSLNGFHTNDGTDIYFGLCRKNRPFQCKKITNLQVPDTIFKNK